MNYDLIVVGGDSAGLEGALAAARLNKRVALVDIVSEGQGTQWPVADTGLAPFVRAATRPASECSYDHNVRSLLRTDTIRRVFRSVLRQRRMRQEQLDRSGVTTYCGSARFLGTDRIEVQRGGLHIVLRGERIVIAAGSRPIRPEHIDFDGTHLLTTNDLLTLDRTLETAIVVGGGIKGMQCASLLASLAVSVVLIDDRQELLERIDRDIVASLVGSMRESGVEFHLGEDVIHAESSGGDRVTVSTLRGTRYCADAAILATGNRGNTEDLNLSAAGLDVDERGRLWCNGRLQTWAPNIYAVGDVVGHPRETRTSIHQGQRAAYHAFDLLELDQHVIELLGTFPEVATVGKTEPQLSLERVRYAAEILDTASGNGRDETLAKLLYHSVTGQLLGVHAVGPDSRELILAASHVLDSLGTVNEFLDIAEKGDTSERTNQHVTFQNCQNGQNRLPNRAPKAELATV